MDSPVDTIEYRGFDINIYTDYDNESPREWDDIGTMACVHSNYNLGDEKFHKCKNGSDLIYETLKDVIGYNKASALYNCWYDSTYFIEKGLKILQKICPVILPLYLLDHSGLWMSTGTFACDSGGWDTSHVGYIYITEETIEKEYPSSEHNQPTLEQIKSYLEGEVETYNDFLTSNIYGYVIEPTDNNKGIYCDDSCWGYYGDYEKSGLLEDAKSNINYTIKQYKQEVVNEVIERREMAVFINKHFAL